MEGGLGGFGVIFLLLGTHQGNRANDDAHTGLADQVQTVQNDVTTVRGEVETVIGEVETLRSETAAGFEALSAQIVLPSAETRATPAGDAQPRSRRLAPDIGALTGWILLRGEPLSFRMVVVYQSQALAQPA